MSGLAAWHANLIRNISATQFIDVVDTASNLLLTYLLTHCYILMIISVIFAIMMNQKSNILHLKRMKHIV